MKTKIYLVRHGQTEFNKQKRMMGWIDSPLTAKGVKNAKTVGRKLKDIMIDRIYSSDLGRAFRAAYVIAQVIGYKGNIIVDKKLREQNYGELSGQKLEYVERKIDGLYDLNNKPRGGESLLSTQTRAIKEIIKIGNKFAGRNILVVTHDGILNAVISEYRNIDYGKFHKKNFNPHDTVFCLEMTNGKFIKLKRIN